MFGYLGATIQSEATRRSEMQPLSTLRTGLKYSIEKGAYRYTTKYLGG